MHILVALWHCAGTVCSLRFVKVFGKKSREWISRQNNATSATTTTRGGSVDGQTASIITALHAVTEKNTLRMYVCMNVHMHVQLYIRQTCTLSRAVSHTRSHTLHALALSQLTLCRSRTVRGALFILFLLVVHWPSARAFGNSCTASCICPSVVRGQCRKCGTSSQLTYTLHFIACTCHLPSLSSTMTTTTARATSIHTFICTCVCVCVCRVWAAFYSPRCCCCWCRLSFVVCFAVARGLH